ncbi:glycosyltransferase family 10 [Clostridium sp. YIM B02555]|uniref:glycosyltransferase family 10 domain-containing protein n=1 Tax=Clostridium sp. YIM B02555 TaxID=2911968 RepID=UPI001EEF1B4C|nr:glycosyltransferase family 10 [Clostridium sp. YIM B02555]
MKEIKIKFVDCSNTFDENNNIFMDLLREKYKVKIADDPDYIIYSVWGNEHLKYDCIRIFYTFENIRPNFNICDYAIGYDYMNFEDRYIRVPYYVLGNLYWDSIYRGMNKERLFINEDISKKNFCDFIYSNGNAEKEREVFFHELSRYKEVDSGGGYLNNIGRRIQDKYEFQKQYKFSIAFENSYSAGYTTEKIIEAFGAGSIPIYWGNPIIEDEFNGKSFINCHAYNSFDEVINLIKRIDNDDNLYLKYLKEPMLKNDIDIFKLAKNNLQKFLINIFEKEIKKAKVRNEWWFNTIHNLVKRNKMLLSEKEKYYRYYFNRYLNNKKVIGWGSGNGLDILMEYNKDIKIEYLVDSNDLKVGTKKNGLCIHSFEELLNEDKEEIFIIILSIDYYEEIKKKLFESNFKEFENFIGLSFFKPIDELNVIEKIEE